MQDTTIPPLTATARKIKHFTQWINGLKDSNPQLYQALNKCRRTAGNNNPKLFAQKIDEDIIAPFLKEVQKVDPDFVRFKQEYYHSTNPEKFDKLLMELKDKGLMYKSNMPSSSKGKDQR